MRTGKSLPEQLVMLAAGGTGGHLFPAFALAEELGRRGIPVELATDMRGDRYGSGFPARAVHSIHAATLSGRSPLALASTGITLARGVREAYALFGKERPSVVVGFGGYPSFPPLLAARMRRIPTLLHEQNAVLGRANKMLARRVDLIATSFEKVRFLEGELARKARLTGNPVRKAVIEAAGRPYAAPAPTGAFNLVVFGGSQGARFFSDVVPPALGLLPEGMRQRLKVVQQARAEDLERVSAAFRAAEIDANIAPFFQDLPDRMAAAHLVIGRAGASTVAELAVLGRPSILVPLPHALDNDQLRNATTLAESGGAWCIEQKDLGPERLAGEIGRLAGAPELLDRAAAAARSRGRPDAVARLAGLVMGLAGGSGWRLEPVRNARDQ
jgi:UDP-N-acetylglucosamine--N-acetylmuramyl-(pentapeptide) pyrophosphoryl-undecaprenol N-acetylglucosamine transferase